MDLVYASVAVIYLEVVMPYRYSANFRRHVSARLLADESVKSLAEEPSASVQTLSKWTHQTLIDAGRRPGTKSFEVDSLAQARRTRGDWYRS